MRDLHDYFQDEVTIVILKFINFLHDNIAKGWGKDNMKISL